MHSIVWLCRVSFTASKVYLFTLKEQVDIQVRRAAVLRALPAYLHEDDSSFLKTWNVSEHAVLLTME